MSTKIETKKINRSAAANQVVAAITGKTSLTELVEKADKLVVDSGGTSKPAETAAAIRRALETAEALGILKLTRPTDIVVEKIKTK